MTAAEDGGARDEGVRAGCGRKRDRVDGDAAVDLQFDRPVADLETLTRCYVAFLERWFGVAG